MQGQTAFPREDYTNGGTPSTRTPQSTILFKGFRTAAGTERKAFHAAAQAGADSGVQALVWGLGYGGEAKCAGDHDGSGLCAHHCLSLRFHSIASNSGSTSTAVATLARVAVARWFQIIKVLGFFVPSSGR